MANPRVGQGGQLLKLETSPQGQTTTTVLGAAVIDVVHSNSMVNAWRKADSYGSIEYVEAGNTPTPPAIGTKYVLLETL